MWLTRSRTCHDAHGVGSSYCSVVTFSITPRAIENARRRSSVLIALTLCRHDGEEMSREWRHMSDVLFSVRFRRTRRKRRTRALELRVRLRAAGPLWALAGPHGPRVRPALAEEEVVR